MTKFYYLYRPRHVFGWSLLFFIFNLHTHAQTVSISGQITDGQTPISGASILVKNTVQGTVSDFDGRFELYAEKTDTLLISYLGYKPMELAIGNRRTIDVVLQEDATALGEVTINAGYYTVKEWERTGSIAKVDSQVIEEQPVNTALEALQGRVTGLDIISTSGLAGGGYTVRIRGQNSIAAGNDPLYVIDGVPFDTGSMSHSGLSLMVLPNGLVNPLNTMDPSSIESIDVLKDADATSIYGSRGSNGVILITTKKGKKGKTLFHFDASTTYITPTRMMDLLHTDAYLSMRRGAFANDGFTEYPSDAYDVNGTWDPNRYTDWQKEFLGNPAYNQTVRASISGGHEQNTFLLGGTYMKETTVYPEDFSYKRGTVHTSFTHRSSNDRFSLQFSGNYGTDTNKLPTSDLSRIARILSPNAPQLYDEDGHLNWENNTWDNPLAALNATYQNTTNNLIANTTLNYNLLNHLHVKVNLGYNSTLFNEIQLNPHTVYNPAYGLTSSSSYSMKNESKRNSWIVEPQMDGFFTLGPGKLEWLIGATFQEQNNEELALIGYGYASNQLIDNLSAANNLEVMNEASAQYKYTAVYGRLNYNINKKYLLNLTGRRDGSSRFGSGNRFANFGALGAAWIFSEETLLRDVSWLSFGKLRASYGTTGNDQIGDYQYWDSYTITDGTYGGYIGLIPSRLLNPYFAWEKNKKLEGALELELWKSRVRLEVAYYINRSSNQLLGIPLPGTTGFSSIQGNLNAVVENTGWEINLQTVHVQKDAFNWRSTFQLTLPKNRLVAFEGLENSTYANQLVIGEPLSVYRLYHLLGVNADTGLFEFQDYNGDGIITAEEDRQYNADLTPKFYASITNMMQYKNWRLDFLFQFVKKDGLNEYYATEPPGIMQNQPVGVLDHWQHPGDQAFMQAYTTGWNYDAYEAYTQFTASSGAVSDASFIRLKTLSLNYKLPLKDERTPRCSIYLQGQNLLTFTKFEGGDPEQYTGYMPPLKRISLGLKLEL